MKKLLSLLLVFSFVNLSAVDDIVGFWKTINDKTGKAESIIAIYEHQGKYYGRLVATLDDNQKILDTIDKPKVKAPGIIDEPYYSGMDIIWGLERKDSKYADGKIVDPEKGRVYNAELWPKKGKLVVRGKVWIFGENQEWDPLGQNEFQDSFKRPDITKFTPKFPDVKPS